MFEKTSYEEFNRTHDFARWLGAGETITSVDAACLDGAGADQAAMVANEGPYPLDARKAIYTVSGGTAGERYTIRLRVVTSAGQKFEDSIIMSVT